MMLSKVSAVSKTRWANSNRLTLFASQINWQYLVRWRVHPCCFRDLRTVDGCTLIPCFASFFWIWLLVVSSSFCIWSSMKVLASLFNFLGLPALLPLSVVPVSFSFLMILVTVAKLTTNSSFFNNLNISAGWRFCPWRDLIQFRV